MGVDRARVHVARDAPHFLEEIAPREHAPAVLEEHVDQLELERAERELHAVDEDAVLSRV